MSETVLLSSDRGPVRILTINRQPARSAREVRSILRRRSSGEVVSLLVQTPDGRTSIVNLRVP